MKFLLYHISKKNTSFHSETEKDLIQRIQKYVPFDIVTIPPLKDAASLPLKELQKRESAELLKHLAGKRYFVLLDENGKTPGSVQFANMINKFLVSGQKEVIFAIGGAYGFDEEIKSKAHSIVSLSKLTFSHQLARLVFLEQLYRSFAILNNQPYHHI